LEIWAISSYDEIHCDAPLPDRKILAESCFQTKSLPWPGTFSRYRITITTLGVDLESLLRNALRKRNWLVHDYFRERAEEFVSNAGRQEMLKEIDECRELFQTADASLDSIVRPLRTSQGITDERIEREMKRRAQV